MAWRDAKASKVRLLLFMASIILGIAAVVSIQLFSTNLKDNIQLQSKALMGADYIIDSKQKPTERAQAIIDSLKPDASEVNFVSMIAFPKNGGTKLVKVRALKGDFPFYGTIDTEPASVASTYQNNGEALVDATLMLQFNIKPGDSIKVGKLTLPIAGALKAIPGSTAISTSVAPPVIIPNRFVESTELLQFGSRKEYQFFYKAADTLNLSQFEEKIDPMLDAENSDLDTHTSTSERLGRRYENVGKFLYLAAFIALLLGCIGIASSVHIYIKEKLKAIAVLKCMGASRKQSFLIFLIQIAGIGMIGGLIGSLIGVGLQVLFPYILQEFLPFTVEISISLQPILIGVFLGLFMSVLFALLPLIGTWYVSPLEVLRVNEEAAQGPKKVRFIVFAGILIFLFLFSFWLLEDALYALSFVGGTLVTFLILAGTALWFMKLIRTYFPKRWGFTSRQSLLNLFRPNNQTVVLVVAIGLGTFLISTLYFTKDILLAKTDIEQSTENASMIILDVQTDQREEVEKQLNSNDLPILDNIPLVTMRMHKLKDRLINEIQQDSTREVRGWILNHEFRTTYRDTLIDSEEIIEGKWIPESKTDDLVKISISDNLAKDAKVTVGDTIVFNVQGVLMETTVGSIRKVDWGQIQLNFSIVFPKGVLEQAPQFNVVTTSVPNEEVSAKVQRDLVAKLPNLTIIDLRQVFTIVEDVLDKVSWIINFMAFFSILTGIIVLIGSVRTSKYQRIKESTLLRTLGAKNTQILKIATLEYVFLGLLGSLVGISLALLSSFGLALFVFQEPFVPSWIPFLIFLPGITLLVLLIGLSNIRTVLSSSPLEVLRREG
ncbi:putative ABC transport system permease protein [Nonlabens dokdonensis]|uniref:ABC transport system permease protein n=2 Tax=Nonlabens dokdonensis TaxID=328515 RepID=A0ABX5PWU3_9FLAO|nr:FtsX-like permease family protein [Nonlabens dokdonensis]AGC78606.1 putative permease domain protein [Nonlabens dokdonensis DSW-6]PZX39265.1 putative ABC transport system permease protein [Nonlabens dokdonensis]